MTEEDSRLLARYFSACRENMWKPSLVAFPRFQLSPSIIHKVPHSFRTTDMLIDAMQQLQDVSFRTKSESPFQELADDTAVKDQAHEGLDLNSVNGKDAMPHESDGLEASSRETVWNQNVCVPGSPSKKNLIHSFFSGDYVTVDGGGNVSVTFVPVLPQISACHTSTKNVSRCCSIQKIAVGCKLASGFCKPTVEFDSLANVTDSGKHMLKNSVSNLTPDSREYSGQGENVNGHVLTTPSKTWTSPKDKWDTPCNARSASSTFSSPEDTDLSPRLTHYMEEEVVPESPVPDVNHVQVLDGVVDAGPVPAAKPLGVAMQADAAGDRKEPFQHEKKNGGCLSGITKFVVSSRTNVLDQTQALVEEPACPPNGKLCTPSTRTSPNFLCDSFSNDFQLMSGGNTSTSLQQAPKYRRLCKYGDKIKKVSSISLDGCHDGFGGNKGKAKRRLDTYIDEEVEVSQDADVSEDEDDGQSEDKYEDSFIDDQATPSGEFSQTKECDGNNGDMLGFYRRSLLTQSPVILPSRYRDASDSSASRTRSTSCSSETRHNSVERVETPKGLPPIHQVMDPSPLWYQQRSTEGASTIHHPSETAVVNCESSSKMDSRKRKLSFHQSVSIPVINLNPEPAPKPSSHLATGVSDDLYLDDGFFEGLDLDAIEAQAIEQWKQRTTELTQKLVEPKNASEISFAPPSFDLEF